MQIIRAKSLDIYNSKKTLSRILKRKNKYIFLKPLKRIVENGSRFWNHYNTSIKSHIGEFYHLKKEGRGCLKISLKKILVKNRIMYKSGSTHFLTLASLLTFCSYAIAKLRKKKFDNSVSRNWQYNSVISSSWKKTGKKTFKEYGAFS